MLAVLTILAMMVSVVVIWNTVRLQREVDERTKHYVSDVTIQLAKDIDNRLNRNIKDLAVSYTHLTLPTNREVEISVVGASLKKKKRREEKTIKKEKKKKHADLHKYSAYGEMKERNTRQSASYTISNT